MHAHKQQNLDHVGSEKRNTSTKSVKPLGKRRSKPAVRDVWGQARGKRLRQAAARASRGNIDRPGLMVRNWFGCESVRMNLLHPVESGGRKGKGAKAEMGGGSADRSRKAPMQRRDQVPVPAEGPETASGHSVQVGRSACLATCAPSRQPLANLMANSSGWPW